MFINYAHRGASEYAAQNTLCSFYLGLACRANGIETDIRRTSDGVLVLFHDKLLENTTDGSGTVAEHTLSELKALTVRGKYFDDKIATLDEFLEHFAWRELQFALELKCGGTGSELLERIRRYDMAERTVVTSFDAKKLREFRELGGDVRTGLLVKDMQPETLDIFDSLGGCEQICPPASLITPELVASLKSRGLSVRAWGVTDTELMEKCYDAGVDGMTVNFPDKLAELTDKRAKRNGGDTAI